MDVIVNVLILLATAAYMEYVAWFTHKYIMHGSLWVLHEDHHRPRHRGLQKNDLFALLFSMVSFILIFTGLLREWMPLFSAGLGVALYGVGYVLFHDIMFHRRIPGLRIKTRGRYLRRIVQAHRIHHQYKDPRNGVCFGFLYPPRRLPRVG
jgi:beta-carotene 3-hydroxylase